MIPVTGIIAENIAVSVNGRQALPPSSLTIMPGTSTAIIGRSGSGKTTFLNTLGLLTEPSSGRLVVNSELANNWSDSRRRKFWKENSSFIFQDYGLIDEESARYNVSMQSPGLFRRRVKRDSKLDGVLGDVGLAGRGGEIVSTFSGGERQRVGIARAIYKRSTYIFADEPTASLDENNQSMVAELLLHEVRQGAAVVIATHDEILAKQCDQIYRLDN